MTMIQSFQQSEGLVLLPLPQEDAGPEPSRRSWGEGVVRQSWGRH
jgi:hypothetical protein